MWVVEKIALLCNPFCSVNCACVLQLFQQFVNTMLCPGNSCTCSNTNVFEQLHMKDVPLPIVTSCRDLSITVSSKLSVSTLRTLSEKLTNVA